jgi:hypothetical protein
MTKRKSRPRKRLVIRQQTVGPYAGIRHVIYLSTNSSARCEFCEEAFGFMSLEVAKGINHLLQNHGCRLLHVGTETSHDDEGKPWHSTVAILGAPMLPPERPTRKIEIVEVPAKP